MAQLTKRQKLEKASLYELSYEYLRKNFHKFKESVKIRVAISMLQIFEKDDSKTPVQILNITNLIREINQESSQKRFEISYAETKNTSIPESENGFNGNGYSHG